LTMRKLQADCPARNAQAPVDPWQFHREEEP
jgi:hypothetical protein